MFDTAAGCSAGAWGSSIWAAFWSPEQSRAEQKGWLQEQLRFVPPPLFPTDLPTVTERELVGGRGAELVLSELALPVLLWELPGFILKSERGEAEAG